MLFSILFNHSFFTFSPFNFFSLIDYIPFSLISRFRIKAACMARALKYCKPEQIPAHLDWNDKFLRLLSLPTGSFLSSTAWSNSRSAPASLGSSLNCLCLHCRSGGLWSGTWTRGQPGTQQLGSRPTTARCA